MAKTTEAKEAKTTAASDPTIAPPPIVPSPPDSEPVTLAETGEGEAVEEPVVSTFPAGVQMHDAGQLPYTADRAARIEKDPARPPVGWAGSYRSCGGCGDFIPTSVERCPKCAPAHVPANVSNGGL